MTINCRFSGGKTNQYFEERIFLWQKKRLTTNSQFTTDFAQYFMTVTTIFYNTLWRLPRSFISLFSMFLLQCFLFLYSSSPSLNISSYCFHFLLVITSLTLFLFRPFLISFFFILSHLGIDFFHLCKWFDFLSSSFQSYIFYYFFFSVKVWNYESVKV